MFTNICTLRDPEGEDRKKNFMLRMTQNTNTQSLSCKSLFLGNV